MLSHRSWRLESRLQFVHSETSNLVLIKTTHYSDLEQNSNAATPVINLTVTGISA